MSYHICSLSKISFTSTIRNFKIDNKVDESRVSKRRKIDLISQINRSSAKVSPLLAEGSGRSSNFDQAIFTNMSYSNARNDRSFEYRFDMKYINEDKYTELRIKLDAILNKLNSL
jgi:four helix bundle protein